MQPLIVGRVAEIGAIERLTERSMDRRAALVIEGEAGIGKTTMWDIARRIGLDRGQMVLSARAAPSNPASRWAALVICSWMPPRTRHATSRAPSAQPSRSRS